MEHGKIQKALAEGKRSPAAKRMKCILSYNTKSTRGEGLKAPEAGILVIFQMPLYCKERVIDYNLGYIFIPAVSKPTKFHDTKLEHTSLVRRNNQQVFL